MASEWLRWGALRHDIETVCNWAPAVFVCETRQANEFKYNRTQYEQSARQWTRTHATSTHDASHHDITHHDITAAAAAAAVSQNATPLSSHLSTRSVTNSHFNSHCQLSHEAHSCYYTHSVLTAIFTLRAKLSSAVYCNRSCLWVCVSVCVCGSVTTITQNCVHRSSPNWICR